MFAQRLSYFALGILAVYVFRKFAVKAIGFLRAIDQLLNKPKPSKSIKVQHCKKCGQPLEETALLQEQVN